jgi:tryptophan halogenase
MHVCVIGTGAAGWMAVRQLQYLSCVHSITVIGSPHIPTVGVGESTTNMFFDLISGWFPADDDFYRFLCDIDAAVKYGVLYQDWGGSQFLHAFVGSQQNQHFGYGLGGLDIDEDANQYMMPYYDHVLDNKFCVDQSIQNYTFHFDANKFISAMQKLCCKNHKTKFVCDTVVKANFDNHGVVSVLLQSGQVIQADYYVSAVGQTAFNQQIFHEKYHDYSHVLLTDRALFFPLPYTNQEKQFHPYTIARAMPHGWRWITPTWSRIGTGYAFSSRHVSIDQAIDEFCTDIGIKDLEPFQVDFYPRRIDAVFKPNHCSIGLASGFLEPLDAPGLSMTQTSIEDLCKLLQEQSTGVCLNIDALNKRKRMEFDTWAAFILWQYRCSGSRENVFWKEHSSIKFDHLEEILHTLFYPLFHKRGLDIKFRDPVSSSLEPWMFYHTAAGRGQRWPLVFFPQISKPKSNPDALWENHFDWFQRMHNYYTNIQ